MSWRPSLPLSLRLHGKRCVVLGAGPEAAARVRELAALGAAVAWVGAAATDVVPEEVVVERRPPTEADLDEAWLAVLTDRDLELAARLHAAAQARRVWFCAVDQPPYLDFHHLAVAREGALVLAIGTEGEAPGLSQRLRDELARVLREARLAPWLEALAAERRTATGEARRRIVARWLDRLELRAALVLGWPQAPAPSPSSAGAAPGEEPSEAHSNEGEPGAPSPARGGR